MRILLIRHGETAWSTEARLLGETDVPLSPVGEAQAQALAAALRDEPIDELVCSPQSRARQTAEIIAAGRPRGLTVRLDDRLREIGFGSWEGSTFAELKRTAPEALDAWFRDLSIEAPGGEPRAEADARIASFLSDLSASPHSTVAIVGHLLAFQSLICCLMGTRPTNRWPFHLYTASLSELRIGERGSSLIYLNRLSHLAAAGLDTESIRER